MQNITLQLNSHSSTPLYRQLYRYVIDEMAAGRIAPREKLPSKRALAQHLGVSINTVDTAYQMLVAEGYVDAKAKSGFFAAELSRPPAVLHSAPAAEKDVPAPVWQVDFGTRAIDTSLFPRKAWARLMRDVLAQDSEVLNPGHRQGDENLRSAICAYLHAYRGVVCTAQQIVVGAGIEYLVGQLARMLRQHTFAVENPGYARTGHILRNNAVRTVNVPVDAEGMNDAALAASGADIAYVTPSHQFPTGAVMPISRRQNLLQWAGEKDGRYIVEDDYDSEFRFSSQPIPAMQGMDTQHKVIYVGTFSKSIAPGIRMAYMVLPQTLLALYRRTFGLYSCTVSRLEQQAVFRLLDGGYFARHLRRLRKAYRLRRDALVSALHSEFGTAVAIAGSHTGLHVLVTLPAAQSEAALVQRAESYGVRCTGLSRYYHAAADACPANTVVLGYAGLSPAQIADGIKILAKAWRGEDIPV